MRHWLGAGLITMFGALCLQACTSSDPDIQEEDLVATGFVGRTVEQHLVRIAPNDRGRTWLSTRGNTLHGDWLLQMPRKELWGASSIMGPPSCDASTCATSMSLRKCTRDSECGGGSCEVLQATIGTPGAQAERVCVGHSDSILDDIYSLIVSAKKYVDITSLAPPDGRFEEMLRNAIIVVQSRPNPPPMRLVFSQFPGHLGVRADAVHYRLTKGLPRWVASNVMVGTYSQSIDTWNHSKIIAVDGSRAIVGGMNLWTDGYLNANPVHDVSIQVSGPAAKASHLFANTLWSSICNYAEDNPRRHPITCGRAFSDADEVAAPPGNTSIIAMGRLGTRDRNPSDLGLLALMEASNHTLRITQQDIAPIKLNNAPLTPWHDDVLDAWIRAVKRGVDVTVITSNPGSKTGGESYSNGFTPEEVYMRLLNRPTASGFRDLICSKVKLGTLRASNRETWANGAPFSNHSKVIIVDDQAFYTGSQNLYGADLAEFGYVVDDAKATKRVLSEYYEPLIKYSARTFIKPTGCGG